MGSAQSARGIQLGRFLGSAARGKGIPSRDLSPARVLAPSRAHFLRRRCAATGSGSAWKGSGAKVALCSGRELYSALPPLTSPLPGAVEHSARCALLPRPSLLASSWGGVRVGRPAGRGPHAPGATVDRGGLYSSAPQPRRVARAGIGPRLPRAARGLRRCRLPTRPVLKHGPRSLTHSRVRGCVDETPRRNESEGRRPPPAEVGSRRHRPLRAHHRPVSPAPSGRWSMSVCDRTRKMVNYPWAGRSQRKLWWRPVAVLTCKSVVRPGYRGERLIEPSSSWFPPKFPSG